MPLVPDLRVAACNRHPINPAGDFVLYWMIANRRVGWNFSLQRAVEYAGKLHKPLVILEALRCDYRWASDRLHRFILPGMRDNGMRLKATNAFYYPFVETEKGAGKGLLAALARQVCVVVTDDFPCFFLPNMMAAAAERIPVHLEKVDSNGLLPMRAADRVFSTAHAFRRFLQKNLRAHLNEMPEADPLAQARFPELESLPKNITSRWPLAETELLAGRSTALAKLPIDHSVAPVEYSGGETAAAARLQTFLDERLARYGEARNQPEQRVASELSPYLHFGHISVHRVFAELMLREGWSPALLAPKANGSRSGWWGVSPAAESFLDELITWRELGYNFCSQRSDYDQYGSLPAWTRQTLAEHAGDPRPYIYDLEEFENAQTHDALWNAAQNQLVREGRIHNYLRMLWGKKILEWSRSPQQALEVMIHLNNKYAVDGRNPNSYSGIFWVLGRYDRAWGPERPIFGKVRYMSSKNTARKVRVLDYIRKYFIMMTALWLLSLALKDSSIVDMFWGTGFVIVTWLFYAFTAEGLVTRKWLLAILVTIWGVRLSLHILVRNWGRGEDFRYRAWREAAGSNWWWRSYFKVFLLQGVILWLLSTPLLAGTLSGKPLGRLDFLGILLWLTGFLFEAIGDWQLVRFKSDPANKGNVLQSGLWRYTRHPNYFGEAVLWWGYFGFAAAAGAFWTVYSPLLMTYLLLRVSGVAMLERTLVQAKPRYAEYVQRTNAFVPWFPRK